MRGWMEKRRGVFEEGIRLSYLFSICADDDGDERRSIDCNQLMGSEKGGRGLMVEAEGKGCSCDEKL